MTYRYEGRGSSESSDSDEDFGLSALEGWGWWQFMVGAHGIARARVWGQG